MNITLRQLAELVHGELVGDGDLVISAARPLGEAGPGDVTFLESTRHLNKLQQTKASAVVVLASVQTNGLAAIKVADPLGAFVTIVEHFHGPAEPMPTGIDPDARVHPTATIGADFRIQPFAVVGAGSTIGARCQVHSGAVIGRKCTIGDDVLIYPNVVLYDGVTIGNRVIIHANAVIGADGFGYRLHEGKHVKIPQRGGVVIEDDVEIGASTAVDSGTFQPTRVGQGTKIDNLVQIGHNCRIGRHNLLVSQMGIAGSSSTGDYVVVAGQVGIADHIHIGDRAVVGAKSGVASDIPAGERMLGTPCTPELEQKRIFLTWRKLPEMRRDLLAIKQLLNMDQKAAG